jgi:hypothetical protein
MDEIRNSILKSYVLYIKKKGPKQEEKKGHNLTMYEIRNSISRRKERKKKDLNYFFLTKSNIRGGG